jgi:hypothetical protein
MPTFKVEIQVSCCGECPFIRVEEYNKKPSPWCGHNRARRRSLPDPGVWDGTPAWCPGSHRR